MEITNITNIDATGFSNQDYSTQDGSLLNSLVINQEFGLPEDKVEIHIISPDGVLLDSNYDFRNYTTTGTVENSSLYNNISLDPKADLESYGYFTGQYDVLYNFYRQLFQSSEANKFYITEISSDRTEIKIANNNISYTQLGQDYLNFITTRNSRAFYSDFLLNAGDNKTYIGVNVALDNVNTTLPSLYIKLYEPLPSNVKVKDTFWIVESISESYSFNVNTEFIAEAISDSTPLKGPNVNIELAERSNLTTSYLNLSNLINSSTTSSYQQLQSWMEEKSIEITVDYNDFSNFVHFSSAKERLENFKYKLTQIQSLQSDLDALGNLSALTGTGYINISKDNIQSKINALIEKFDGYEYFLYYESGSNSWPKTNSVKPYINDVPTSLASKTWFGSTEETSTFYGGKLLEADNFDNSNRDYVWNILPEYIKEDSQNSNLELFVAMMGQHYDNIWTYAKDITDLQVADNRIDHGISKDLVADTLRNFGIKLYTNSRGQDDLYLSLLGIDSNNNTLPSTGSLSIDTFVTASNHTIPNNDIVKETYKRIYHNLPYLLKSKGTKAGLRALINCFGIPETILKVKEYGGTKKDQNLIEQFNEKFNYALKINSQDTNPTVLNLPFGSSEKQFLDTGFDDINADTIEFRFKLSGSLSPQSLLEGFSKYVKITKTTGEYANIEFSISGEHGWISTPPINLPLYNNDWWTLNISRKYTRRISESDLENIYTLTVGNKDSNGIQFLESSSFTIAYDSTPSYNTNWDDTLFIGKGLYNEFAGEIQEVRYWIGTIPTDNFKDHILNPTSISYTNVTGSFNNLIFRLPLGAELDKNNFTSVHPSSTSSFYNGGAPSSDATIDNSSNTVYSKNHELYLVNTPNVGSITQVDQKIRVVEPNLVPGDTLTPYISIQKPEDYPYTNDLSIVDITLSPQDSINEDIISQLGSFNIDDYIGDPRLNSLNTYPNLDQLRDFYFQKYSKSQNVFDIIKLLSYFDNSLFKMIKDFVPAKTNLSTGLTIKSHILERNKIARHEPTLESTQHSGSIETAFISGSNGLNVNLNTNHTTTTQYLSNVIEKSHTDKAELFNGELGGTVVTAHTQTNENIVYELNHIETNATQDIHDNFYRLPLKPTLNNVLQARTSPQYLDIDYAYNPITPVNFNFLTSSLFQNLNTTAFSFLNAPVQDSNYTLKRHINPRYNGSKTTSALYNVHTVGDKSYGSTAAIDYHPVKFAYFNEITSQSATLNGRSNINIKYLIDSGSNVIELTEANKNIFDVQDIFNRVDANIALEDVNKPSKQKALNGLKPIYAGGFRYEPILLNESTTLSPHSTLDFIYNTETLAENPDPNSQQTLPLGEGLLINQVELSSGLSSPSLNYPLSDIYNSLDSTIKVNVTRNTAYDGEIRRKIVGSVTVTIKISPRGTFITSLYNNTTGTGTARWTQSGPRSVDWLNDLPAGDNLKNAVNSVGAILIEPGITLKIANDQDTFRTVTNFSSTNLLVKGAPLVINTNGLDRIQISSNDTKCLFNPTNAFNSFGNPPTYSIPTYQDTSVTGNDSLVMEATFPIEGLAILPAGVGVQGVPVDIELRTLGNQSGYIRAELNFFKTFTSPPIQLTTAPSLVQSFQKSGEAYYLTAAPAMIYIKGASDRGFSTGTANASTRNWYFERGSNGTLGAKSNFLTASYDLSKLYYEHVMGDKNYFTQNLTSSLLLPAGPHIPIDKEFIPQKGDLVKFYDNIRKSFPFTKTADGFEREIIKIYPPINPPVANTYNNRLVFELSGEDIPTQACSDEVKKILNFIILSKTPDETNIVVEHEKQSGVTSAGIVFPSNISEDLKGEAGNIVKGLKSQNLI